MTIAVEAVQGVGPSLAGRLRHHFGGDEALQEALARQDVAAIAAVEGVGPKRARRIVQSVHGHDPDAFLATESSRRIWEGIVSMAQAHCGTDAGAQRVALRAIARSPEEASQQTQEVLAWMQRVADWDRDAVRRAFSRMRPLVEPRPTRTMEHIVVCDADSRARLERLGADRWVPLCGPEELRRPRGVVLVVGELDAPDAPGVLELPSNAGLAEVAPEAVLAWFRTNRAAIEALDALQKATSGQSIASEALAAMPLSERSSQTDLRQVVAAEHVRLQSAVRERIAGLALTGADLLAAMEDRLPPTVEKTLREEIDGAHRRIEDAVGFHVAAFMPGRPVILDEEAVAAAVDALEGNRELRRHEAAAVAARSLAPLRARIEAAHREALAWEADFAWACFALEKRLRPARWGDRLVVQEGLHLGLPRDTSQPVAYHLGGEHPVALLTGANSGGKTTLLEMLAQVAVMARFGLPVPADATVPWLDSVHLLTHRRSLDAGAFESFLRRFLPLASPGPRRLVLADEVEAITELTAAARIIRFFLERLGRHGHLGLFVTHMAPLLIESGLEARIDGIQSTGLDEHGALVVDRVPRIGVLATSTPELIIERIARSDPDGPWTELLADLRGVTPK